MSSTETQEDVTTPSDQAAQAAAPTETPGESLSPPADKHADEGHDHTHEGHNHTHAEAPTLNPELTRSIEVDAPAEDVTKAFQAVTKRYAKQARIPGFRVGKVPPALIRSRFAREVRQEVLESLVSERFRLALEQQDLRPVSQPQVSEMELAEGKPLRFRATFEVLPEIDIEGYDSVPVQRPDTALSDAEFNTELQAVLEHHAVVEPVEEDRPLGDGDWAEISFKGKFQELAQTVGEAEPGSSGEPELSGEDALIQIGGPNTLQAFNDALRGTRVGQELTFEATYPPEFGEARLAGKTVAYDVNVKAIKRKEYPERDEELAKQLGNYESWTDFETQLRDRAATRKKNALESQARDIMVEGLVQRFQFPVPETFVQNQIDARLERGLRALAGQGMSAEAMRQLDFGRLRGAQRDQAISEVKASLLLDRIADREGVTISDEDLERELLMLSIQQREPLDTLRKRLTEDGSLNRIREGMRREKTGAMLYEKLAS